VDDVVVLSSPLDLIRSNTAMSDTSEIYTRATHQHILLLGLTRYRSGPNILGARGKTGKWALQKICSFRSIINVDELV
jgi:hypothetical protein